MSVDTWIVTSETGVDNPVPVPVPVDLAQALAAAAGFAEQAGVSATASADAAASYVNPHWADIRDKPTTLAGAGITDAAPLAHVGSTDGHPVATTTHAGMMSAADKARLDTAVVDVQVGAAGGVAPLDASGQIPAIYLPSYVDDVVPVASVAALPTVGETGKIYATDDTALIYRWSGSAYVEISASPGSTDAVPEGSNLYMTAQRVRDVVLTGLSTATSAVIAAADSVLGAFGKLQAQITGHIGSTDGHPVATTAAAGMMSAADKAWLDGLAAAYPISSSTVSMVAFRRALVAASRYEVVRDARSADPSSPYFSAAIAWDTSPFVTPGDDLALWLLVAAPDGPGLTSLEIADLFAAARS
jgi:hypothetical protein